MHHGIPPLDYGILGNRITRTPGTGFLWERAALDEGSRKPHFYLQRHGICPQQSQRITAIPERDHWLLFPSETVDAGKTQPQHWDLGVALQDSTGGFWRIMEFQPCGSSLGQLVLGLVHWVLGQLVGFWVSRLIWGRWILGCSLGQSVGF